MIKNGVHATKMELSEETLKSLAVNALDLSTGTKLRVNNVGSLTEKAHSTLKNAVVLNFLAKVGTSDDDQYAVSVLVKKFDTAISNGMLTNELQVYSTFFKDLQPTGSALQRGSLYNLVPRPYLIQKQNLFLENLESIGFQRVTGKDKLNLDFSHCLHAIETIAKFHASSYYLRRQLGQKGKGKFEMLQKYPFLNQSASIYSPKLSSKLGPVFENAFELVCRMIELENPSLAFKLRRKVDPTTIFEKCVRLLEDEKYENDDFYVICHNNFLVGNLLFKYVKNEPKECRVTSFQSIFVGPLASDLVTFLLTSTSLEFRIEFEEKLLAFYCDAFEEQLLARNHNNPLEDFDIEDFHRRLETSYKKMLEFGFYNAVVLLPLYRFSQNQIPNNILSNADNDHGDSTCPSMIDLLAECGMHYSGNNLDFQKCVLNDLHLKDKFIGILKQLIKCRVLL